MRSFKNLIKELDVEPVDWTQADDIEAYLISQVYMRVKRATTKVIINSSPNRITMRQVKTKVILGTQNNAVSLRTARSFVILS